MNGEQIAEALKKKPDSAELMTLMQACEPRRAEIRARVDSIDGSFGGDAFARPAAERVGLAALKALDDEAKRLREELNFIDYCEDLAAKAREVALTAEARKAIPIARRKIPDAVSRVREALRNLEESMAQFNGLIAVIGEYPRLVAPSHEYPRPAPPPPFTDAELAVLIRLRDEVWQTRTLTVLEPPRIDSFKESCELYYIENTGRGSYRTKVPARYPSEAA